MSEITLQAVLAARKELEQALFDSFSQHLKRFHETTRGEVAVSDVRLHFNTCYAYTHAGGAISSIDTAITNVKVSLKALDQGGNHVDIE